MANVANIIVGTGILYYNPTPGTLVGNVTTEFGYTEDGAIFEYSAEITDIMVEEETFVVNRFLRKEEATLKIICAESLLANIENAMAGALTGGAGIVDLGGGAQRAIALKFVGLAPGGLTCTIYMPYAHPIGTVTLEYKKDVKTKIAATFKAYQGVAGADVVTITYA